MSEQDSAVVLAANGVGKSFGSQIALKDLTLSINRGELVAIIGPNGAGKTTLLSILAGSLAPDDGALTVAPERVGWVPQQPALYNKLSVRENLRLFARLEKVANAEQIVTRMLELADLKDRADDVVGKLSGGNKQRVNIAIGLLSDPTVLLLDEPSTALDPRQRERLWQFVTELARRGTAVIYSTHYIQEAERHADKVVVIADGELLFVGSTTEFADTAHLGKGEDSLDFEGSFVNFLHQRGH